MRGRGLSRTERAGGLDTTPGPRGRDTGSGARNRGLSYGRAGGSAMAPRAARHRAPLPHLRPPRTPAPSPLGTPTATGPLPLRPAFPSSAAPRPANPAPPSPLRPPPAAPVSSHREAALQAPCLTGRSPSSLWFPAPLCFLFRRAPSLRAAGGKMVSACGSWLSAGSICRHPPRQRLAPTARAAGRCSQRPENTSDLLQEMRQAPAAQSHPVQEGEGLSLRPGKEALR
ncbi:60S ribosomal protein L36a isoform X2 [Falco cherrug]|uniref:60S ribosomal protein L36a isoform X2 n=1 Tax=Falco cherrug TaxID=345164 RepID=UPI0024796277|nr:60S ribosomal protein L36a isoform X2 [Falco cherrug]